MSRTKREQIKSISRKIITGVLAALGAGGIINITVWIAVSGLLLFLSYIFILMDYLYPTDYIKTDDYAAIAEQGGFLYKLFISQEGAFFILSYLFWGFVYIGAGAVLVLIIQGWWGMVARLWAWVRKPRPDAVVIIGLLVFFNAVTIFLLADHYHSRFFDLMSFIFDKVYWQSADFICDFLLQCHYGRTGLLIFFLLHYLLAIVVVGWRLKNLWRKHRARIIGWFGRLFFPSRWKKP